MQAVVIVDLRTEEESCPGLAISLDSTFELNSIFFFALNSQHWTHREVLRVPSKAADRPFQHESQGPKAACLTLLLHRRVDDSSSGAISLILCCKHVLAFVITSASQVPTERQHPWTIHLSQTTFLVDLVDIARIRTLIAWIAPDRTLSPLALDHHEPRSSLPLGRFFMPSCLLNNAKPCQPEGLYHDLASPGLASGAGVGARRST